MRFCGRTLGRALAVAAALSLMASAARADLFERLPDGRIAIRIYDKRVAFPDEFLKYVEFPFVENCPHQFYVALDEVLKDQSEASCIERLMQNEKGVSLLLYEVNSQKVGAFLGHFDHTLLPHPLRLILTVMKPSAKVFVPELAKLGVPLEVDDEGYTLYGRPLPSSSKLHGTKYDPPHPEYVLPASRRLMPSSRPLDIGCGWVGAPTRLCGVSLLAGADRVRFHASWLEGDDPESSWVQIDLMLRKALPVLLIDGPKDFQ